MRDQLPNLGRSSMPLEIAARSHALGEVEPELRVWNRVPARFAFHALLVAHIGQNGLAQFAILQPQPKSRQIGRERFDMVIVILRVFTQIVASQLSRRPGFVKGMAEQVILRDARLQLLEEFGGIHEALWDFRSDSLIYERNATPASGGDQEVRQVARMKAATGFSYFLG